MCGVAIGEIDLARPVDPSTSHRVVYADISASNDAALAARSSTRYRGNKSTDFFGDKSTSEQLDSGRAEKERTKRRGIHAALVRLLEDMESGDGSAARKIGQDWASQVKRCGGTTRKHVPCGQSSYFPHSCDFPLCPWYQAERARRVGRRIGELWEQGYFPEPKFWTFSPPNVQDLGGGWKALGAVMTALHRRKVLRACRGGFRALETTVSKKHGDWNIHCHQLVDSGWVTPFPVWDIKRVNGRWKVERKHLGLAREFTELCQKHGVLKSERPDFNLNNPDHWYFINLKVANKGAVKEIGKYIAKGAEVVAAGAGKVVDYMVGAKNKRLIQGFGTLYGMNVTKPENLPSAADLEDWWLSDEQGPKPEAPGECPYENCPSPHVAEWDFVGFGPPVGPVARDARTGAFILEGA